MSAIIPPETLAEWRADACVRGGVPKPGDADPHARYLANRIVRLIDALEAATGALEATEQGDES